MTKMIVIGAGVMGSSVAFRLAAIVPPIGRLMHSYSERRSQARGRKPTRQVGDSRDEHRGCKPCDRDRREFSYSAQSY